MAANARRLMELGMAGPLAAELVNQITTATGNKRRLAELGMIGASYVASVIAPKTCSAPKLVERGFPTVLAKEMTTQINA